MSERTVLYEQENNIVTITYNRPDNLNTINGQMREELNQAWTRFLEDETAWVAIVTGKGSAHFGRNQQSIVLKAARKYTNQLLLQ